MRRLGVLGLFDENDAESRAEFTAFREALGKLGWTDGRNLRIDYRWVAGQVARIDSLAKDLVALRPEVILCRSTPVTAAVLKETRTIPIVFMVVSDPVGDGLVASFARPGGNVTGFTNVEASLGGKWLELLKELAPRVTRISVMFNPKTSPGGGFYYWRLVENAAASFPVKVTATTIQDAAKIEHAIIAFAREPGGGLLVLPDITNLTHRGLISSLAERHRLPAIYSWRFMPKAGGLISYGVDYIDLYRRAASYVDRILRGAKPSELPVQAPVKFELIINRKTAKALGLAVPQSLVLRADEVIE